MKALKPPFSYRGMSWGHGRWRAEISTNGQKQSLGRFDDKEAVVWTYSEKAEQLHDDPIQNFLTNGSINADRKKKIRGQFVVYRPQLGSKESGDINQAEEDAVIVGVKGKGGKQAEDETRRRRPRKRGRRQSAGVGRGDGEDQDEGGESGPIGGQGRGERNGGRRRRGCRERVEKIQTITRGLGFEGKTNDWSVCALSWREKRKEGHMAKDPPR